APVGTGNSAGSARQPEAQDSDVHVSTRSPGSASPAATQSIIAPDPPFVGQVDAPRAQSVPVETDGAMRIGQYEVIRELGRGGMGVVYLARDERLGRKVALKLLQTHHPEFTRRFITEARATARCSHENIVVIHEVGEHRGNPFMVLEYLEGQTLSALLKKSGPLAPSRAAELMVSVVRALVCAHEQGIVHRDLKPDNIFITSSGAVKVLDFGIAKVLGGERVFSRETGSLDRPAVNVDPARSGIAGTLAYMSPEQWGIGGSIDHRTDIWASGIILYEMLAGVHPLASLGPAPQHWVARLDLPMPSVREAAPNTPEELAQVVDGCLRKVKTERVADAVALLRALEPFLPGRASMPGAGTAGRQMESGPYTGLRAFQEEDAGRFFGRDRETLAMATRIREYPLMAAVGPSGIGKSSFVRAGVVPLLKHSGENWQVLVVRPGREPVLSLAALLAPLVSSSPTLVGDLGAQREIAERLRNEPGYLGGALRASARRDRQKILLFVDQFEELYTLGAELADRLAFTACLSGAADDALSPVRVITSIRSDFLGRLAEDPHFMNELSKGLFFLGPPSTEGLREALVRPCELAGYRFESEAMVLDMVRHLEAVPGALPLLQFTAAQLWETRDVVRRQLTEQSYRQLGGITGALASHADRVVAKLPSEQQALCRSLLLTLVTPERTRAVRNLDELEELAPNRGEVAALVDHLVQARLLVIQTASSGGASVEIVHESLIGTWPTLRRWLEESHEDSVFLDQLRNAARQWHAKRHDAGLLWGGEMVDELARFQRRYRGELPEVTRAFATAVFAQKARTARRNRWVVVGAVAALLGMLAAAMVALVVIRREQQVAEQNANSAERRLRQVEAKERERQAAERRRLAEENLRRKAEEEVIRANSKIQLSNEELLQKNAELVVTLKRAEELRHQAETAQKNAQENESVARRAEDRARRAAGELEDMLKRERERSERLSAQLGSPLVEVLQ
ncbi:MAG TPA: serine/threonine-protein kinase, partial [Polyangiaceae bacterium]|nr:serine/threonine-protein kinase [Polyangiaceae bacterium]